MVKVNIWKVRDSKNISSFKLARMTGIDHSRLKRIEQEKPRYYPNALELEKIAYVLDVYIEDLIESPRFRDVNKKM